MFLVQQRWDGMLPLPHKTPLAAYPNSNFSLNADRAIFAWYNTCCHHPSTMTGHKEGSHKKRTPTHLETTAEKWLQKQLRLSDPQEVVTTPLVVTHTQDDSLEDSLGFVAYVVDTDSPPAAAVAHYDSTTVTAGSPVVDHTDIAAMAAGDTNLDPRYERLE